MTVGALCALVVDDVPAMRLLLRELLAERGVSDVREAGTVGEAALIRARVPLDLIVADLRLPGESGWVIAARCRRHDDPLCVVLTGLPSQETAARAMGIIFTHKKDLTALAVDEWIAAAHRRLHLRAAESH